MTYWRSACIHHCRLWTTARHIDPGGLKSQRYQPSIEVFVVDNASSDGSVQMLKERFPWVRLIENTENLGFARANNQAIDMANGRYILLLNSDTWCIPARLQR